MGFSSGLKRWGWIPKAGSGSVERRWEAVPDSVNYLRKGCCVAVVELCFFTEGNPTQRQRTQNPAIFLKTKRTKLTKILMSILTSSSVRIRANNISSHLSGQFLFSFCLNKTTCPIFFSPMSSSEACSNVCCQRYATELTYSDSCYIPRKKRKR